ncbi:MAG: gas vesicle protein GvpL [Halohasta sp.]
MTAVDDGRYLYCLVRPPADEDPGFATTGIEDEPVSVVTAGGVGAVVHACESLYDSDDPRTIQRWLLRHQGVVDEAGEAFGTPLPFQFDTVLSGGSEALVEWLAAEADRLESVLERLAGRWEYRIEVRHHESARSAIAADDERLSRLESKIDDAEAGTAYLLEQQYEKRLSDRLRTHRQQQARAVADRIAPHVDALESLGRRRSTGLVDLDGDTGGDTSGDTSSDTGGDTSGKDDAESIARFAVLATDEGAAALGEELDAVAAEPGVEVRFTGPWPPYTFAPAIDSTETGGADGTDR